MKKLLVLFNIMFISLLFGCISDDSSRNIKSISVKELPYKVSYAVDEQINLEGLVIEAQYDDNSTYILDDYEVLFDDLVIGQNKIIVKYGDFETYFYITINDIEKLDLIEYKDFEEIINKNFHVNNYSYLFESVTYGGYRDTNTMIMYDANNYVETNIYGYEILVDDNGYVVAANTKVDLEDGGFVLSGHGTKAKLLKEISIGDFVIYFNNYVFVYKNTKLIEEKKVFIDFLQIIDKINYINDIRLYNDIILELNELIPDLNQLYDNYDLDLAHNLISKLEKINDKIIVSSTEYNHKYSYIDKYYNKLESVQSNPNSYIFNSKYTEKLYIGGFRNSNTIVYYDQDNYRERNKFGFEVAVDHNNIIIKKDILVDLPENGYILSGHGSGAEYIKQNLNVGDKVDIQDDAVYFYRDIISNLLTDFIYYRNYLIQLVNEHQESSIPHDYKYIDDKVNKIDELIRSMKNSVKYGYLPYNIKEVQDDINNELAECFSQLIDYNLTKSRAMWYYPFIYPSIYDDTSLNGVRSTLDKFQDMGFNEILIIPFCGNYILYDSDYFYKSSMIENLSYGEYGNDYLKCFITEAHNRGIKVTAFTQTFKCYEEGSKLLNESHYQMDISGSYSKGGVYYYDICNDDVQDVLSSWYIELVSKYDFDKVEYDIIRYSAGYLNNYLDVDDITNVSSFEDPGYTEYSMNKFMMLNNLDGNFKQLILTNKDIRKKWIDFKEQELINFISETSAKIKEVKPNILISAAVFNNYDNAKKFYLQDYKKWLDLGIIDQIEPMIYSTSNSFVEERVEYFRNNFSDYNYRIGIGYDIPPIDLMIQIITSSDTGYVLFNASDYLQSSYYYLLSNNHHFINNTNIDNEDELIDNIINDIIDKLDNYYEIKYDTDFSYLIDLLNNHKLDEFKQQLVKIEYMEMVNYLYSSIDDN